MISSDNKILEEVMIIHKRMIKEQDNKINQLEKEITNQKKKYSKLYANYLIINKENKKIKGKNKDYNTDIEIKKLKQQVDTLLELISDLKKKSNSNDKINQDSKFYYNNNKETEVLQTNIIHSLDNKINTPNLNNTTNISLPQKKTLLSELKLKLQNPKYQIDM